MERPALLRPGEMFEGFRLVRLLYAGATSKTKLTAEADAIPLVLKSSATGARVEDFAIHAVDAVMEGGSSIAVLADGATAEPVRCDLVSGDGVKGADGEDGDPTGASAKAGAAGSAGKKACSDLDRMPGPDGTLCGGAQVTNDCGSDEISIGGRGGDGNVTNGGGGSSGQTGTKGQAGLGGASIALVSLSASITLTDCTLTAGKGGDGGAGGDLQPGGPGGLAGLGGQGVGGSNPGCSGGQGGKGGNGGPGGGGLRGPSIGVAFQGSAPEKNGETKITPAAPGLGGPGGSVNVAMNAGADGVAAELQELP